MRQHGEHGLAEVAAGDLAVVPRLQRRGVQAEAELRLQLRRQRARAAVEVAALRAAHAGSVERRQIRPRNQK